MAIVVRYVCGHEAKLPTAAQSLPSCACGETKVERVEAPNPKIRGHATGPLCQTSNMGPIQVNLAPGGPLRLRGE